MKLDNLYSTYTCQGSGPSEFPEVLVFCRPNATVSRIAEQPKSARVPQEERRPLTISDTFRTVGLEKYRPSQR